MLSSVSSTVVSEVVKISRGVLISFLAINVALALVTGIAALFFAFGGYLGQIGISPAMSGLVLSADALAALLVQPLIAPLINPASARRWLAGGSLLLASALFALAHGGVFNFTAMRAAKPCVSEMAK